jgi:energy-coupling factor transporter ATP-binding protein EcfA2
MATDQNVHFEVLRPDDSEDARSEKYSSSKAHCEEADKRWEELESRSRSSDEHAIISEELQEMAKRISHPNLVLVQGPQGSGKASLPAMLKRIAMERPHDGEDGRSGKVVQRSASAHRGEAYRRLDELGLEKESSLVRRHAKTREDIRRLEEAQGQNDLGMQLDIHQFIDTDIPEPGV